MKRISVVLYGASGHGKSVANIVSEQGHYNLVGWLDDTRTDGSWYGLPILGGKEVLTTLKSQDINGIIISIGNNALRKQLQIEAIAAGLELCTIIHPMASVASTAAIGKGSVVMPLASVGPDTQIGSGCIINTGCSVDHDCTLGDYVHISPGVHLSGNVTIGDGTHVGTGTSIKQDITIGSHATIGVGSAVVRDITDSVVAYGVPATVQ